MCSGIDDIVFCYYFVYVRYMLSMDGLMMIMIMVMCIIIIIWFWITCWLVSLIGWLVFDCNRINFEWIWKWTKKKKWHHRNQFINNNNLFLFWFQILWMKWNSVRFYQSPENIREFKLKKKIFFCLWWWYHQPAVNWFQTNQKIN